MDRYSLISRDSAYNDLEARRLLYRDRPEKPKANSNEHVVKVIEILKQKFSMEGGERGAGTFFTVLDIPDKFIDKDAIIRTMIKMGKARQLPLKSKGLKQYQLI